LGLGERLIHCLNYTCLFPLMPKLLYSCIHYKHHRLKDSLCMVDLMRRNRYLTNYCTLQIGYMWVSEGAPKCNFFGVQYGVSVTPVLNTQQSEKKTWISLTQYSDRAWPCPEIVTQLNSYGNTQQLSKLVAANFERLENDWHSSFFRDINSPGGWVNGWALKGNWIQIKCALESAPDFTFLNGITVKYIDSPLTNK